MTIRRSDGREREINKSEQTPQSAKQPRERKGSTQYLALEGNKVTIVSATRLIFFSDWNHASAENSESQPAFTRPGLVRLSEENLDVVPDMPNGAPLRTNSGATVTVPSEGEGDGVEEAGSTVASS